MGEYYNSISTLIGIVIGVIVTVGADYVKAKIQYRKDLTTLKYEFQNDIHEIDYWLELTAEFKGII